jgi:hypothetical protein
MAFFIKGAHHRVGHSNLAFAVFVSFVKLGNKAALAEDLIHCEAEAKLID